MKKILFITLLLLNITSVPVYAKDKEINVNGSMVYEIQPNGEIVITGYYGKEQDVVIPDMIAGHLVTGIAENVFTETNVKNVTIPETVTNYDRAFDDEIKIKTVSGGTVEQEATSEGSNTQDNTDSSKDNKETNKDNKDTDKDNNKETNKDNNKETNKDSNKDTKDSNNKTNNDNTKTGSNEEIDLSYFGDDEGVGIFDPSEKYDEEDIEIKEETSEKETKSDTNTTNEVTQTTKPKFTFTSFICCVLTVAFVLFAPQLKYLQKRKK